LVIDDRVRTVEVSITLAVAMDSQFERGPRGIEKDLQCIMKDLETVLIHLQLERADLAVGSNCSKKCLVKCFDVTAAET